MAADVVLRGMHLIFLSHHPVALVVVVVVFAVYMAIRQYRQ